MPCISKVTKTKMTDAARVVAAMRALGITGVVAVTPDLVSSNTMDFSRQGGVFTTKSVQAERLKEIQRKYSELTVRDWAKRRGFAVAQDGNKMTLINRRG